MTMTEVSPTIYSVLGDTAPFAFIIILDISLYEQSSRISVVSHKSSSPNCGRRCSLAFVSEKKNMSSYFSYPNVVQIVNQRSAADYFLPFATYPVVCTAFLHNL